MNESGTQEFHPGAEAEGRGRGRSRRRRRKPGRGGAGLPEGALTPRGGARQAVKSRCQLRRIFPLSEQLPTTLRARAHPKAPLPTTRIRSYFSMSFLRAPFPEPPTPRRGACADPPSPGLRPPISKLCAGRSQCNGASVLPEIPCDLLQSQQPRLAFPRFPGMGRHAIPAVATPARALATLAAACRPAPAALRRRGALRTPNTLALSGGKGAALVSCLLREGQGKP